MTTVREFSIWDLRLPIGSTPVELESRHSQIAIPKTENQMASVAGLAPARPGLKDRLRELLCIHGLGIHHGATEITQ